MVTTIQINEDVKKELDRLKSPKNTYEEVIVRLISIFEECKRGKEGLLIEGCKEMAKENLRITKEFESIEELKNWVW